MLNKIEDFLLNKFAGKLIARGVALAVAFAVSVAARNHVTLDSAELTALLMSLAMAGFEWVKAKRMANPASPAVQTDLSKVAPVAAVEPPKA